MSRPALFWLDFFFDLPFDLGSSEGTIKRPEIDFDSPSLGRIPGWEDASIDPRTGVPEYPEPGVWPSTTWSWRRRTRRPPHPAGTPWDLFGDELKRELTRPQRAALTFRSLRHRLCRRYVESNAVVRLVRLDSPPAVPLTNDWISSQFTTGLRHLNEFLVPLSWAAQDPIISPLHPRQLPPVVAGFQTDVGTRLQGRHAERWPFALAIHPYVPSQGQDLAASVIDEALQMAPEPTRSRPFLPILDFMVATRGALARGQNAQAVIDATTSIELLVDQVIRQIGPRSDPQRYATTRLRSVMEAPFKNRLLVVLR